MKTCKPSGWAAKGFVFLAILVALPILISPAYAQVKGIATCDEVDRSRSIGRVILKTLE